MASTDYGRQHRKDIQFLQMARLISERSKCSSRHVGAVLVRDGSCIGEGYNGSPRGCSLCQNPNEQCRRRTMGFGPGQGLEFCPASHAEMNCIVQAARNGISTKDATMFCWCGRPCKWCMALIINAGIKRLVYLEIEKEYDELSGEMLAESDIEVCRIKEEDVVGI